MSMTPYQQLTLLSDELEWGDLPREEIQKRIDEIREDMRRESDPVEWLRSRPRPKPFTREDRQRLTDAADRCKPIFDREMKTAQISASSE